MNTDQQFAELKNILKSKQLSVEQLKKIKDALEKKEHDNA